MSETSQTSVSSTPCDHHRSEEPMLREDTVQEILARVARGEGIKTIARELGVDRKTVKRWRRQGHWQPRQGRARSRGVAPYLEQLTRRGPEVGWNAVVLHRELQGLGFTGGVQQVRRAIRPWRAEARWATVATVRYETGPGEQAQVDFGQVQIWIGDHRERVHLFVMTLGYSRRLWVWAYPHERLSALLDGHERAFRHFGGVPLTCLYDNPRTLVLGRREREVRWHPVFEDFIRYYGVTPRVCQPYRARTKGKVESGVKYVKRNALAGRRFVSWEALNAWLESWTVTIADQRVHGTTHERPIARFARETLTPLGARAPYRYERERIRRVPTDALVAIGAARYSVPVQYVGTTVTVQETTTHYEIFQGTACIARHAKAPRHTVVMDRTHYQGLLRPGGPVPTEGPPQWDPAYQPMGEVMVRDLARYAAVAETGGGV
ncbi:MAG: IS21 family transposase [Nitrospira sp.]|nr:IS21 family transposase [Nitrospira sp.]MDH5319305.1 IS21 family transposase [Nitrospira sp.]